MKKQHQFLVLILCCLSASTLLAQPTARGNFFFGSRVGFSANRSHVDVQSDAGDFSGDGDESYQLNIAPGIGYMVVNNLALGIGMDYISAGTRTREDPDDPGSAIRENENINLLFGPFVRLFLPINEDNAFFIGTSVGFGQSRNQFLDGSNQTIDNRLLVYSIGPGFTIFSHGGLSLETLVKYNYARANSDINLNNIQRNTRTSTNSVDFSVGIQFYFGGFRGTGGSTY